MEQADSAPVRRLINMVFLMAIRDQASDIHFEPFEEDYKMRYKCDGVLFELPPPLSIWQMLSLAVLKLWRISISLNAGFPKMGVSN